MIKVTIIPQLQYTKIKSQHESNHENIYLN